MANLKVLSQRIVSVRSTKKITGAMKMIAAAYIRASTVSLDVANQQKEALANMICPLIDFFETRTGLKGPLLAPVKEPKKVLYVIISSDKGLCGGYNMNLLRMFREQNAQQTQKGVEVSTRILGSKLQASVKMAFPKAFQEKDHFATDSRRFQFADLETLVQELITEQLLGNFEAVYVIYNHFINSLTQQPALLPLLPLAHLRQALKTEEGTSEEEKKEVVSFPAEQYFYEPSDEEALENSIGSVVTGMLLYCLRHAQASEIAARMTAMDSATKNATDMIDRLSLEKNRIRQSLITTELTEIISGAEAL